MACGEAVRLAPLIEGGTLGIADSTRTRLAAAIQRCEQADPPDAARILAPLLTASGLRNA